MTFRLRSFAGLPISEPTLFLDTDMVCVDRIDAVSELSEYDVSVCVREFNKDMLFDPRAMDIDLREYEGRTLDESIRIFACAVIAKNPEFWSLSLNNLIVAAGQISSIVFGEQEAMRNVLAAGIWSIGRLGNRFTLVSRLG